jgi:hypothetical protein
VGDVGGQRRMMPKPSSQYQPELTSARSPVVQPFFLPSLAASARTTASASPTTAAASDSFCSADFASALTSALTRSAWVWNSLADSVAQRAMSVRSPSVSSAMRVAVVVQSCGSPRLAARSPAQEGGSPSA